MSAFVVSCRVCSASESTEIKREKMFLKKSCSIVHIYNKTGEVLLGKMSLILQWMSI